MKVPLLDLKPQYQALKDELDEALIRTAESQYFILGPEVVNLEQKFCDYLGCKFAIGVSSGTDALLLALMALDIQPGDEIIVPTYSFFATAGVVSRLNAVPVFVDSDPVTFNIDPPKIEEKITDKTKVILPVHLYGQTADMAPIMELAKKYNLKVVEDGAQAISSVYKDGQCAGTIGDIGCFSFFPSKNLGCFGDGGLVVTNDEQLAESLRIKRVHGGKPKYYHKVIGGNFRLDAIQAAVLSVKLPHLDNWSEQRRQNAADYTRLFIEAELSEKEGVTEINEANNVLLPKPVYKSEPDDDKLKNYHIYNQYIIRVDDRDGLRKFLADNEISSEIYYPIPFHMQDCFTELGYEEGDFPIAEYAAAHSLALPIYPELEKEQIEFVVTKISEFIKNR